MQTIQEPKTVKNERNPMFYPSSFILIMKKTILSLIGCDEDLSRELMSSGATRCDEVPGTGPAWHDTAHESRFGRLLVDADDTGTLTSFKYMYPSSSV